MAGKNCTAHEIKVNNNDNVNFSLSRREIFKLFKKNTKELTGKALILFSEDNNEIEHNKNPLHNRGKTYFSGKRLLLIKALTSNNLSIINNLYDSSDNEELTNIIIDMEKCNLCGLCYFFCPTGALSEKIKKDKNGISRKDGIDIDIMKCLKCSLCITICRKDAIKYDPTININELIAGFSINNKGDNLD